jgi:spermidine synthase
MKAAPASTGGLEPEGGSVDRAAGGGIVLLAAFAAGAATMTVELAAVRLLAPWFGTSLPVWTNVLGVVLLGLTLGYLIGGRLSRGSKPLRTASYALYAAACVAGSLPSLARPVALAFVPEGLSLDRAQPLLVWGSLAASLILYLPPVLCLGALQPLLLEASARRRSHVGSTGAVLYSISTLGSLVGCFGTAYGLIPLTGLSTTFHAAAAWLALCGALLAWSARGTTTGSAAAVGRLGAVIVALIGFAKYFGLDLPSPPRGGRVLESRETAYQSARIVEDQASGYRHLQVNEGFDSFQSAWRSEPGLLGEGYYYDLFALPAWWGGRTEGTWRVLVLGAGAASTSRVLEGASPTGLNIAATLVEIDREIVELGARWMDAGENSARQWLAGWDARAALGVLADSYDLVVVDAYANQIEIPPHLCSREFFGQVLPKLAPDGWLALNVGGFGFADPVVASVGATLAQACESSGFGVLGFKVPASRNVVFIARRGLAVPEPGTSAFRPNSDLLRPLVGALELPGAWRRFRGDEAVALTDDLNPIEALQQCSLAEAHELFGNAP